MRRIILLYLLIWLGVVGCGDNTAQQTTPKEENPSPALTPEMTEEAQPEEIATEAVAQSEEEAVDDDNPTFESVVILTPRPVETLDPYLMSTVNPEDSVAAHLWDTLVWINDDLILEPVLAESWRLVNDTTWEFKLRQNVSFHNGEMVNAEAVKFSIERSTQVEEGTETFAFDVGLQQINVIDDYTIQLVTVEPQVSLPYHLASVEILPPTYYASAGQEFVDLPIGSGPYRFLRQETDGSIILEANSEYWQGAPALATLIFRSVPDKEERVASLLAGEAELITDLTPQEEAILATATTRFEPIESTRRLFVGIRTQDDNPLADRRVRQALNYAIDVDSLVENFAGGYGQRYGSWVNPPHNLESLTPWPYDPAEARSLLAEAGYPDGFHTTLDTPVDRYYQDQAIAVAIAEQLAAVGVQVQVQPYEWPGYVRDHLIPRNTSPLFLLALYSQANGLEDTANLDADFPFNPTLWRNFEFEELVAEAGRTFNETQRQTLLNQAQEIAYEESPWIWLWRPYDFYGVAAGLDWQPRADGFLYLYTPTPADQ